MPKRKPKTAEPSQTPAARFRDRIVELRRVRCGDIEPHPKNPRTHSGAQLWAVTGLLVEVGKAAPLVAFPADGLGKDGDFARLMYVDGHGRQVIDPNEVWPIVVTDLTRAEADKMCLCGDATASLAGYDPVALDALMRDVDTGCAELQEMLDDLWQSTQDEAVENAEPAAEVTEYETPEPAAEVFTRPGDLWIMGRNRLLCGDSTNRGAITGLLDGQTPAIQIVDPPFDSDYSAWDLLASKVAMVWERGVDAIIWEAAALAGQKWGVYELVFSGGVRGWPCDWFPCTVHDCVRMWRSKDARKSFDPKVLKASGCRTIEDGTRPFSVQEHAGGVLTGYGGMSWGKALVAMEIAMSTIDAGELVYDPCAGSGTSLIAAEKHGRPWVGCEYQEKWADLIVRRWEEFTGQTAVCRRNGQDTTLVELQQA